MTSGVGLGDTLTHLLKWTVLARLRGARPIFLSVGFGSSRHPLQPHVYAGRVVAGRLPFVPGFWISRSHAARRVRRDDPVYPDLAYSLTLETIALVAISLMSCWNVVGLSPFCYCDPRDVAT